MNGYMKIRVCSNGSYFDCWQKVVKGVVVDHVDDYGDAVELPKAYEAHCLTGQMEKRPPNAPEEAEPEPEALAGQPTQEEVNAAVTVLRAAGLLPPSG